MDTFDLGQYPLISGYHSLGFLNYVRSDVLWLDCVQNGFWRMKHGLNLSETCGSLEKQIDAGLSKGRPVALLVWDEDLLPPPFDNFTSLCNKYSNEDFYLITQLPEDFKKIFTFQGGLQCKILDIPWTWLNDIFGFYQVSEKIPIQRVENVPNYLCMVGRPEAHKINLIEKLCSKNLHHYGKITVSDLKNCPASLHGIIEKNEKPFDHKTKTEHDKMAGQTLINNVWISSNVHNFMHIQSIYSMPLIINAETTTGIYHPTEKSLWPCLLGRLYLIHGPPGIMSFIQRFHDLDQNLYCDTRFDTLECAWTEQSHLDRLDMMLDTNRYLITHAREIWNDLQDDIEKSRWTIGYNVLRFCLKQLDKIPIKNAVDQ